MNIDIFHYLKYGYIFGSVVVFWFSAYNIYKSGEKSDLNEMVCSLIISSMWPVFVSAYLASGAWRK